MSALSCKNSDRSSQLAAEHRCPSVDVLGSGRRKSTIVNYSAAAAAAAVEELQVFLRSFFSTLTRSSAACVSLVAASVLPGGVPLYRQSGGQLQLEKYKAFDVYCMTID